MIDQINWNDPSIKYGSMRVSPRAAPQLEPKVDELVSKAAGFKVYTTDPRLLKLIVKWKQQSNKALDDMTNDDYLSDPRKVEELKRVLTVQL